MTFRQTHTHTHTHVRTHTQAHIDKHSHMRSKYFQENRKEKMEKNETVGVDR